MEDDPYLQFCDQLWRDWLDGKIQVPDMMYRMFELDAAPEPYIPFRAGLRPLVALTTNPGWVMSHQTRAAVEAGRGPLASSMDYSAASKVLGEFYLTNLPAPAARRVAALGSLSALLGFDGVLEVESCPFHSRSVRNKAALLRVIEAGGLLGKYVRLLEDFLKKRTVVVLSAVSTRHRMPERLTAWARFQAHLAGMDLNQAQFIGLPNAEHRVTAGGLISGFTEGTKILVLMMGGNHLPAAQNLRSLANKIREANPIVVINVPG